MQITQPAPNQRKHLARYCKTRFAYNVKRLELWKFWYKYEGWLLNKRRVVYDGCNTYMKINETSHWLVNVFMDNSIKNACADRGIP